MDVRDIQRQAWDNKVAKGFNVSDIALEFGLLTARSAKPLQPGGNGCRTSAKSWQTSSYTWLDWRR